jgi:hypothetical protein
MTKPLDFLREALASYEPYLGADGELNDPVFGVPAQYGTAYFARAQALVARQSIGDQRTHPLALARRAYEAALRHVADPELRPNASGYNATTGELTYLNHRDFFWPPLLNCYRIFKELAPVDAQRIRDVDILKSFRSRPPSNWAMVWLCGEWKRMGAGLSPTSRHQFDDWLAEFFAAHLLVDRGLYLEPGYPNSYDLFTRVHLAEMLADDYDGRWRGELERLMETGLRRSLAVQLSDGSLASAHRSTGQTWTLGAQIAFFTLAAHWFRRRDAALGRQAEIGARRAYASLVRWQRPGGLFSPVENLLPPKQRIGYETYTFDANYGILPLGFLANAIHAGFDDLPWTEDERAPQTFIEHKPFQRALVHAGPYSLQLNATPAEKYDGWGITDLTVGVGRRLQFASSAFAPTQPGKFYNLGLAREAAGGEIEPMAGHGWRLHGRDGEIRVTLDATGAHITERAGGRSLLIPYLRDDGTGEITQVTAGPTTRFQKGTEAVLVEVENPIEQIIDQPTGYQNRRGLCGLLRLELRAPTDTVRYHIRRDD